jgi:hypothetical protein
MKTPLFGTKPTALDRQRRAVAASATATAKLAELRAERERHLTTDQFDNLDTLVALDAKIAGQEQICRVHQQRLAALDLEVKAEHRAELERQKTAALVEIEKKYAAISAAAAGVDKALAAPAAAGALLRLVRDATSPHHFKAVDFILSRTMPLETKHLIDVTHRHIDPDMEALEELRATRAIGADRSKLIELFGENALPRLERLEQRQLEDRSDKAKVIEHGE